MPGRFVAAAGCAVAIALTLAPGCTNTPDDALGKRQSALDFELEVIAVDDDAVGGDTHTPEDDTTAAEDVTPVEDVEPVDDADDSGDVDDNSTDAGGEPDAMPDAIGPDGESPDTGEPDGSEPDAKVDAGEPDAKPDAGEPDTGEPDTLSDTGEPDTSEPDTSEPDTTEPDTSEPDTSEPDTSEPDTSEPDTSEPDTSEPDSSEPDTGSPDAVSDTSEPDTGSPDTTTDTGEPDTGQPDTGSPDTTTDTGEPDTTPPECTDDADCADTDACNGAETCVMGSCEPGTAIDCQDGDLCNGEEVCNPEDGSCSAGEPLDCDDGEYCSIDGCNANTGCTHTPRDCDDLNPCTEDTCSNSGSGSSGSSGSPGETGSGGGSCQYKAIEGPCNDGDPCTLNDSCQQGQCYGGEPKCVDGVDCTIDGCNPADGSCSYIPSDSACNDGDACNGEEVCTPAGCVPGGPVDCDDGLECTEDSCSGGMCQHEDIPDECECTEQPQTPVSYSVDITLGKGGQDNSGFFLPDDFKCPALGGSVGASFVLKIDGQNTPASCANAKEGDKTCKETASLKGTTELAFKLCKETVKFSGSLGHTHKKEVCLECDDNCEQTCGDEGCIRDDYDLKVGASYSKFYGVDTSTEKSFFKIAFKCGASIGGGVNAGGNYFDKEREEGFDCAECEECTGAGISLGVDLAGSAGCNISVAGPLGFGFSVGLANIASLNVGLYGGGSGESGECQGKACGFIGIDFKLQINGTPLPCINLGWLGSFGIRCGGFVKGCAEGNICTSGTSSYTNRCPNGWGLTPGFGCNVGSCR